MEPPSQVPRLHAWDLLGAEEGAEVGQEGQRRGLARGARQGLGREEGGVWGAREGVRLFFLHPCPEISEFLKSFLLSFLASRVSVSSLGSFSFFP